MMELHELTVSLQSTVSLKLSVSNWQVRRHVMELRDLSNLSLKDSEEPKVTHTENGSSDFSIEPFSHFHRHVFSEF